MSRKKISVGSFVSAKVVLEDKSILNKGITIFDELGIRRMD